MSTHVFRYGDPVVPGVHELSKATLMADEKPYVYHLLPASQHIGGAVLKAAAGPDSTAEYTIDLGGEPAPVYSYLHLHPDTALAIQSLNVTVHHSPCVLVEARIRQYNASGVEDFSVPLDWQPLPEGQPYALDFATDVTAIVAGGATMLEYRTSPVGGGTFAAASEVTYTATATTVSISELRDVLVTICDEKDNYRFGFNGMEKDNEVKGIGNSLDFGARIYDSRLGKWLSLDPMQVEFPSWSPYNFSLNNPILLKDPDGREPTKSQAGTAKGFVNTINTTGTKLGLKTGNDAHVAMLGLASTGDIADIIKHGRPMPVNTQRINTFKDKYIYTQKAGWIDMAHFMFYAGKAYGYKVEKENAQQAIDRMQSGPTPSPRIPDGLYRKASIDPVSEAVQDGYHQEMSDRISAKHSAYSYEDLPSDKLGADFGANYFDPNSKLTFGEQLQNYLNRLGATDPQNAPNYNSLPANDAAIGDKPSETNHTTKPMYTTPSETHRTRDY